MNARNHQCVPVGRTSKKERLNRPLHGLPANLRTELSGCLAQFARADSLGQPQVIRPGGQLAGQHGINIGIGLSRLYVGLSQARQQSFDLVIGIPGAFYRVRKWTALHQGTTGPLLDHMRQFVGQEFISIPCAGSILARAKHDLASPGVGARIQ